jgi:hypothetical protein
MKSSWPRNYMEGAVDNKTFTDSDLKNKVST